MKKIIGAIMSVLVLPTLVLGATGDGQGSSEAGARLDDILTLYQPYVANISAWEDIYFLVGSDPKNSQFQISFKYRFFDSRHPLAQDHRESFSHLSKNLLMPLGLDSFKPPAIEEYPLRVMNWSTSSCCTRVDGQAGVFLRMLLASLKPWPESMR
jgi:hypothetical protein